MEPNELRQLRLDAGLSQIKLAHMLGVHRSTIIRWEAGTIKIPKPCDLAIRALLDQPQPE